MIKRASQHHQRHVSFNEQPTRRNGVALHVDGSAYIEVESQPQLVHLDPFSFDEAVRLLDQYILTARTMRSVATNLGITENGTFLHSYVPMQVDAQLPPPCPITPPPRHRERDGRIRLSDFATGCDGRDAGKMALLHHSLDMATFFEQMHRMWRTNTDEWAFWCFVCKTHVPLERVDLNREPMEKTLGDWSLCHICWASPMCPRCVDELRDDLPCQHCVQAMRVVNVPSRLVNCASSQHTWADKPQSWTDNFKTALQLRVSLIYWTRLLQRPVPRRQQSNRKRLGQP